MKRMFVVVTAMLFTLGFAGLGFSESMSGMDHSKHADQKTCGIANCCQQHKESMKNAAQSKTETGRTWSDIVTLQPTGE